MFAHSRSGKNGASNASAQNNSPEEVPDWGQSLVSTIALFCLVFSMQLYNNTLRNWASLGEKCTARVRPILYANTTSAVGELDALLESALHLGWTVLLVPRVSRIGLPFIKDMYFDALGRFPNCLFYAYANGDILFDRGLTDTLTAVAEVKKSSN